jgi:acetyl-CoA acetyltransferase
MEKTIRKGDEIYEASCGTRCRPHRNISGGLKSKGHPIGATGASQVYEIVKQLRGELTEQNRQVEGAKVGLVDTLGGDGVIVNLVLSTDQ